MAAASRSCGTARSRRRSRASSLPSPSVRVSSRGQPGTLVDRHRAAALARYVRDEPLQIIRTEDGLSSNSDPGAARRHPRRAVGRHQRRRHHGPRRQGDAPHPRRSGAVERFRHVAPRGARRRDVGGHLRRRTQSHSRTTTICHVTTREGLFDNVIFDLIEDDQHARQPVDELGARHLQHPARRRCTRRAMAAGRASPDASTTPRKAAVSSKAAAASSRSAGCMRDGRLWFATQQGALVIDPGDVGPLPPAPRVLVERVTVDGADAPAGRSYRARWEGGAVRFTWSAPTFRAAPIRFRYRLEGFDPEWIEAGTSRLASYTNLPPGELRLPRAERRWRGPWAPRRHRYALTLRRASIRPCGSTWRASCCSPGLTFVTLPRARPPAACSATRAHRRSWTSGRGAAARDDRARARRGRAAGARRRMQDAQRLESLGLLAGGIAHDFNNLLVGILGRPASRRAICRPVRRCASRWQQIERAATRAAELTCQMLAYSGRGRFVARARGRGRRSSTRWPSCSRR